MIAKVLRQRCGWHGWDNKSKEVDKKGEGQGEDKGQKNRKNRRKKKGKKGSKQQERKEEEFRGEGGTD